MGFIVSRVALNESPDTTAGEATPRVGWPFVLAGVRTSFVGAVNTAPMQHLCRAPGFTGRIAHVGHDVHDGGLTGGRGLPDSRSNLTRRLDTEAEAPICSAIRAKFTELKLHIASDLPGRSAYILRIAPAHCPKVGLLFTMATTLIPQR